MKHILYIILTFNILACKDMRGNPHHEAMPPQKVNVHNDIRVEPANWWTGMNHNTVELLVHKQGIGSASVTLGATKWIALVKTEKADSPNYLFVTLRINPDAPAQTVPIQFKTAEYNYTHPFPVLAKRNSPKAQGIDSRDVIYLIFPDRFANGDPSNDNMAGMLQGLERDSLVGRHGGDLKGVRDHLDYIQDLGMTAIWLNPELENDQDRESYHGYAITDHYRVDRRMGTNEDLRALIDDCHKRGIKVIRDVVLNHIGNNHYWMKDLPQKDWINTWPEFTRTTYRAPTLVDPYAAEVDRKLFNDGWFDTRMPDLNQRNPHVATYLIQQAIWWVEYAGFDGLRIDTYTYSDPAFTTEWCRALLAEYPALGMFGEIWDHSVPIQGFFADDQPMSRAGYDSNLPGVIDFQLAFAIQEALSREQGWTEGAARIYYTLAQDYFYKDPYKNQIFLDNHDLTRFYTMIGENFQKFKSGIAFLMTTRGIPQIYYATEILGTGDAWPSHGNIRKDFPGGWAGDTVNKFTAKGRTALENEAHNYVRTLTRYRNATPALQTGKLTQFVPIDGVYTYFRYDDSKTVMILLNTSNKEMTVDTKRFAERMHGYTTAKDVLTGHLRTDLKSLTIPANSPLVLELMP